MTDVPDKPANAEKKDTSNIRKRKRKRFSSVKTATPDASDPLEPAAAKRKRKRVHRGKSTWADKDWKEINKQKRVEKKRKKKSKNIDAETEETEEKKPKKAAKVTSKPEKEATQRKQAKLSLEHKLNASRFRYLNEQLYSVTGEAAQQLFADDTAAFNMYHTGYRQQVAKWPVNPLTVIIKQLKNSDASLVVADLGCGDAELSAAVPQTVHSFDLVAANERVTAADISNVPLEDDSVDVCVFCLSLMGTNLADYLREANRILKNGGSLKIAEIMSRFTSLRNFLRALQRLGFELQRKKPLSDMFVLLELHKVGKPKHRRPIGLQLQPCRYKKR